MADLKSFLIDLALNADLMQRYTSDPKGTVTAAGLSVDDQAVILAGDAARLRTALGRPDNDCMSQIGVAVRDAKTGAKLSLPAILPLEQKVKLDRDIELTVRQKNDRRQVKLFKAGDEVVRHRDSGRLRPPKGKKKAAKKAKQGKTGKGRR